MQLRKETRTLLFQQENRNLRNQMTGFHKLSFRQFHKLSKMFSLLLNAYKICILGQKGLSCTYLAD